MLAAPQFKIIYPIIMLDPVFMMNSFMGVQFTPYMVFHNDGMLWARRPPPVSVFASRYFIPIGIDAVPPLIKWAFLSALNYMQ